MMGNIKTWEARFCEDQTEDIAANKLLLAMKTEIDELRAALANAVREPVQPPCGTHDEIEAYFVAGQYALETATCPHHPETVAAHWWTRGFAYSARLIRAIKAENPYPVQPVGPEQPTAKPDAWAKRIYIGTDFEQYVFSATQYGDFQTPLYTSQPVQPATWQAILLSDVPDGIEEIYPAEKCYQFIAPRGDGTLNGNQAWLITLPPLPIAQPAKPQEKP